MEVAKENITLEKINLINRQLAFDNLTTEVEKFKHTVTLGGAVDFAKKFVIVRVDVSVNDVVTDTFLGSVVVDFVYTTPHFDDIFIVSKDNMVDDKHGILTILSQQSIAAMRGIMFESFRGTPLHNAYLPISLNQDVFTKASGGKKYKQK
jgi:hypothetical protein